MSRLNPRGYLSSWLFGKARFEAILGDGLGSFNCSNGTGICEKGSYLGVFLLSGRTISEAAAILAFGASSQVVTCQLVCERCQC